MANKKIRILYHFAGARGNVVKGVAAGTMPDTYLIGMNHLGKFGFEVDYIENKFINYLRRKKFNLVNIVFLFKVRKYDVVFSASPVFLVFIIRFIFRFKQPIFICYNTFLTNLFKRNKGRLRRWMLSKAIESMDAIICPSKAQINFLLKQGYNKNKIYFIPTGADVDFFKRKKPKKTSSDEKFILSVGKDNGRDYRTLIKAVKDLSVPVKIVAFPRNFKDIDITKLPNHITIQALPFTELLKLYYQSLFVVVPTKKEGNLDASDCSGHYVILDAMCCGKAIIASRRSTIHHYITHGQEGLLVNPEDPDDLRRAIKKLLNNPELAQTMGDRAQKKAAEFTTEIFAKKLAEIIFNLVKNNAIINNHL